MGKNLVRNRTLENSQDNDRPWLFFVIVYDILQKE